MKLTIRSRARLMLLSLSLAIGVRAQEPVNPKQAPLNLDSTAIRGNQELPKVLYIVPWKDPAMAELAGRPVNSLVEEVLAPVDREVFRRQTRYFSQLYGAGKPSGGDPPAAGPATGSQ